MAANVLEAASTSRVVYWAHNAHVAAPENGRTTGAILRGVIGCDYLPIAITFGEGGFLAFRSFKSRRGVAADSETVSPQRHRGH
jgi:erythromycin esterase-like protein